jgi:CheY-like chemotaxis protein
MSVTDTGAGITIDDQAKIFDKFKQVGDTLTDKPKGTGLGLPISKEIIEHHGGSIWVESEEGVGSTFFFSLPLKDSGDGEKRPIDLGRLMAHLRTQVGSEAMLNPDTTNSILVVDDEANIRSLLQQELTEAGFNVRQASNGKEALDKVRNERPDLIILDVMMPEMNGFDLAAVLKNDPETMDIPIIILSVLRDKERGYRLGIDRYLTKPIEIETLLQEIDHLLEQGKSRKKVMVVDEDQSTIKTLGDVLQSQGYQVVEANGAELLKSVLDSKPDIILLNSVLSENRDIIQSIRFEKGMENVLFLIYQ